MKDLAPKLLAATCVVFAAGAIARGCSMPITQWSPEHIASANATSTAIAPSLEATRTYNTIVVPAIQVEEAVQATLTVQTQEKLARAWRWVITIGGIVGVASLALAVCSACMAFAWRSLRVARLPPARAWRRGQVVEMRGHFHELGSGAVDAIAVPKPADMERIAAYSKADAARIRTIASVIKSPGRNRVERRVLELVEQPATLCLEPPSR